MSTEILSRNLVPEAETWNLQDLFLNFDSWDDNFSKLPSEDSLETFLNERFKGKLNQSPSVLFECLQHKDFVFRQLENLYVYAHLRQSEDVENAQSSEKCGKIDNTMALLSSKFAFIEPEILTISKLDEWILVEPLKTYAYKINELLRKKSHILSEKEESLLSRLQVPLSVYDNIHSKWNNVDLKFAPAKDKEGKEHLVTNSRYSLNLQSQDRTLRENNFISYYSEVAKWRNTITENYYGNMIAGSTLASVRNFKGYLESSLFEDDIPVSLYENLIQTVRNNLNLLHKSMGLRKNILKIDAVAPYDRYVSLFSQEKEPKFSWEEGCHLVLEAIKPMGEEYVAIARKGLTVDRWVDRAENKGKRSGAFSWGTYDSRPYMLQSWTGTLGDVYTLAHELGHSMHSYYSHHNQPYHTSSYTIFVAEVASTLNEALLSDYILTHQPESVLAKMVLSESIQNFEGTVLRQVLFATFEKEAARISDNGEVFTPDMMEEFYLNLNKEWYGDSCVYPDFNKHEWMRIPHFYSAFYVYKYATSYCASLSLAEKLKDNPTSGQERIFALLKAGGSMPSLEILNRAGVNLLSPEPIENAFLNYKRNLERIEKIYS
ncbi:MAG: oligoendopeptidase F [Bdellovibrionota bacterium]